MALVRADAGAGLARSAVLDLADLLIGADLSPVLAASGEPRSCSRPPRVPWSAAGDGGDPRRDPRLRAACLHRRAARAALLARAGLRAARSGVLPRPPRPPASDSGCSRPPGRGDRGAARARPGALDRAEWVQRQLFRPAGRLGRALGAARGATGADRSPRSRPRRGPTTCASCASGWPGGAAGPRADRGLRRRGRGPASRWALPRAASLGPLQEALYPLYPVLAPVSRWFLEADRRDDDGLVERLRAGALREDGVRPGSCTRRTSGPAAAGSRSTCRRRRRPAPAPLIVALHGGTGTRRDFLWAWLREARTRGALLLSPTAQDRTWSIMGGEDVDARGWRPRWRRWRSATRSIARACCSPACRTARPTRLLRRPRRGMPLHPPGPGLRRAAPVPAGRGRHPPRARPAHLPGARRARLDVSGADRPHGAAGAGGGGGAARLPRDRGPLPHLSARRERADPGLAGRAR